MSKDEELTIAQFWRKYGTEHCPKEIPCRKCDSLITGWRIYGKIIYCGYEYKKWKTKRIFNSDKIKKEYKL